MKNKDIGIKKDIGLLLFLFSVGLIIAIILSSNLFEYFFGFFLQLH